MLTDLKNLMSMHLSVYNNAARRLIQELMVS